MAALTKVVIAGLTLLAVLTACDALKCNMCNTLMPMNGGYPSPCPQNSQYHAMNCSSDTKYCLKINGTYTQQNSSRTNPKPNITVIGEQRNCATPYEIDLFYNQTVNGDQCVNVNRVNINMTRNSDGTVPNMTFVGRVCFCSGEACNSAIQLGMGFSAAVFLTLLTVLSQHFLF